MMKLEIELDERLMKYLDNLELSHNTSKSKVLTMLLTILKNKHITYDDILNNYTIVKLEEEYND